MFSKKKDNRYNLLNKQSSRNQFDEMIQLQDFRYSDQNDLIKPQQINPYYAMSQISEQPNQINVPSQNKHENQYPNYININGICFKRKEEGFQKKNKLPMMQVKCWKCLQTQAIPGNSNSFECYNCQQINQCQQMYGLFLCGCCSKKVCYQYGTSQHIKCTRCNTINKVHLWGPEKKQKSRDYELFSENSQMILSECSDDPVYRAQNQKQQIQDISQKYFNEYPNL